MPDVAQQRFKMPQMEGAMARWYAVQRRSGSQLAGYREQAVTLTEGLPSGADVLEVAPGPGYLAIELARLGRFRVTGLDISHTFVEIASENARRAGVDVEFHRADVESLPFPAGTFDLIVCQAAFKNFRRPVTALDEMHRVLRPGGTAVIQDMSRDATRADIREEVRRMRLNRWNAFATRRTLAMLRLRASTRGGFEQLAARSAFGTCAVQTAGMNMEVRLTRS